MFGYNFLGKSKLNNVVLMLRHVGLWLMSQPAVFQNPNFKAPVSHPDLANGVAIYCVHGFFDRPSSFSLVADRILPYLPSVISSVHLSAFDHRWYGEGIEYFAEELKNQILANHDKHVILMGHSRGGLVVSYLTEYLAKNAGIKVEAVFAITAPFGGAAVAIWPFTYFSTSVNEMQLNSSFLVELSKKMDESDTKYYYFASTSDPLVTVDSSFREQNNFVPVLYDKGDETTVISPLQPTKKNEDHSSLVMLDFHDHLSIMSSHRMVSYITGFLNDIVNRLVPDDEKSDEKNASESHTIDDVNYGLGRP